VGTRANMDAILKIFRVIAYLDEGIQCILVLKNN
jgi:hypothetical protein